MMAPVLTAMVQEQDEGPVRHGHYQGRVVAHVLHHPEELQGERHPVKVSLIWRRQKQNEYKLLDCCSIS